MSWSKFYIELTKAGMPESEAVEFCKLKRKNNELSRNNSSKPKFTKKDC